jgi:hypothetical protein
MSRPIAMLFMICLDCFIFFLGQCFIFFFCSRRLICLHFLLIYLLLFYSLFSFSIFVPLFYLFFYIQLLIHSYIFYITSCRNIIVRGVQFICSLCRLNYSALLTYLVVILMFCSFYIITYSLCVNFYFTNIIIYLCC